MRILLIEDDAALREAVAAKLRAEGFEVTGCADGDEGGWQLGQDAWDLVLLDRMLPGRDGLALLRGLRRSGSQTPVLLLTARGAVSDRVEGLDAGADDYLTKPFDLRELSARVRALIRRPVLARRDPPEAGGLSLDETGCVLTGPGGSCTLSRRECALLSLLLQNAGRTLSRETLLARVWGPDAEVESTVLDTYIHFARRRLAAVGARAEIRNRRGVGYLLCAEEAP